MGKGKRQHQADIVQVPSALPNERGLSYCNFEIFMSHSICVNVKRRPSQCRHKL